MYAPVEFVGWLPPPHVVPFGLTGLPFAVIVSWWISPAFRRTTRNLGRKLSGKTTDRAEGDYDQPHSSTES